MILASRHVKSAFAMHALFSKYVLAERTYIHGIVYSSIFGFT